MDARRLHPLLVPLDGSAPADHLLRLAEIVAELVDGHIHALFVGAETLSRDSLLARMRIPPAWAERIEVEGATGDAASVIPEVARRLGAAAIVLSSHGATGDLSALAGHVTLAALSAAPCPVFVVRSALSVLGQAHRLRHLRRILVPLDGTPEAVQSVTDAARLAERAHARLLMLHIVSSDPLAARPHIAPAYSDQYYHELEAWRDEFVRIGFAACDRPADVPIDVTLRLGEPALAIAQFAAEEDCDLIVAAWGGRLSPGRAAVVRKLLAEAPCPLLFSRARVGQRGADKNMSGRP